MKNVLGVLAGVVAFFGAKYGVMHLLSDRDEINLTEMVENSEAGQTMFKAIEDEEAALVGTNATIEEQLEATARAITKTLPLQMDPVTTMTKVTAGPGKRFTYDYQISDAEGIGASQLEAAMRPQLEKAYRSKMMEGFRENDVLAIYRYSKTDGELIVEIQVSE